MRIILVQGWGRQSEKVVIEVAFLLELLKKYDA